MALVVGGEPRLVRPLARGAGAVALSIGGEPRLARPLARAAIRADAGVFSPVRPGGAARGGGDRALFDTHEHGGLVGSAVDPLWRAEGGLVV